ncbi:MAG: hypothetical protein GEV09_27390, partial [Pseudonocardiaceae bacterium]|nr:hypothetical protein [Pseudonocardiaceae bacterium]
MPCHHLPHGGPVQDDQVGVAPDLEAVVVDLEDAVAAADKEAARAQVLSALDDRDGSGGLLLVRVNPVGSPWFADDVPVAARADGVVLPKYQRPDELAQLRERLGGAGIVVVGIETGRGVADCRSLLSENATDTPEAVYFGAEDYIADLGGRRTTGGAEVLYARSQVCLAAHLAGAAVIDQAVVDVRDDD